MKRKRPQTQGADLVGAILATFDTSDNLVVNQIGAYGIDAKRTFIFNSSSFFDA